MRLFTITLVTFHLLLTQTAAAVADSTTHETAAQMPSQRSSKPTPTSLDSSDLVSRSLEIARQEAKQDYRQSPSSIFSEREVNSQPVNKYNIYSQYATEWREKVVRVANLNYPEEVLKNKIDGKVTLTVVIRRDGSLERTEITRSSGKQILDSAAVHIVQLAAPFAPLPQEKSKQTGLLKITRTWTFNSSGRFESD